MGSKYVRVASKDVPDDDADCTALERGVVEDAVEPPNHRWYCVSVLFLFLLVLFIGRSLASFAQVDVVVVKSIDENTAPKNNSDENTAPKNDFSPPAKNDSSPPADVFIKPDYNQPVANFWVGSPFLLSYPNEYEFNKSHGLKLTRGPGPFDKKWDFPRVSDKNKYGPYIVNLAFGKTGTSSLKAILDSLTGELPGRAAHYFCPAGRKRTYRGKLHAAVPKQKHLLQTKPFHNSAITTSKIAGGRCGYEVLSAVLNGQKPFSPITDHIRYITELGCTDSSNILFPQIAILEKIKNEYKPHEIAFVLTTRDDDKWVRSVNNWDGLGRDLVEVFRNQTYEGEHFEWVQSHHLKTGVSTPEADNLLKHVKRWHEDRMRVLTKGFYFIELNLDQPKELLKNFTHLMKTVLHYDKPIKSYDCTNVTPHNKIKTLKKAKGDD